MCERELETEQNCHILTPTLLAITAFLSHSPGLLNREPTLLGAGFLYRILSPTGLVSKLTDFLSSPSYIIVQRLLLLVGVTIALIQPIHGQGYNSDIPRPNAHVIFIGAFPILTVRPSRRSIYNKNMHREVLDHNGLVIDLSDNIKRDFFQVMAVLILLCGCTTWALTKHMKQRLHENYARMIRAVLNQSS